MRTPTDLSRYVSVLPYASELFGIYQPLLGWRSGRQTERFGAGLARDKARLLQRLTGHVTGDATIRIDGGTPIVSISPGTLDSHADIANTIVMQRISERLPRRGEVSSEMWQRLINSKTIGTLLAEDVPAFYSSLYERLAMGPDANGIVQQDLRNAMQRQLKLESSVGGLLTLLADQQQYETLTAIFFRPPGGVDALLSIIDAGNAVDAFVNLDTVDPTDRDQLKQAVVSPISVIHLFRQFFFELDTFLGAPEDHVWLSPGSQVELTEERTRTSTVERTVAQTIDRMDEVVSTTRMKNDLSDAVSSENEHRLDLGASVTATYSAIEATASLDYSSSKRRARSQTHRIMRDQSQRLSSSIRQQASSTYHAVTTTGERDFRSYELHNTTNELINYELRRKMRQVCVQVQDVGTYLCWQTHVDDPGRDLGISRLVDIAEAPELGALQHPQEVPMPQPFQERKNVTIPFISVSKAAADNEGEVYVDGVESDNTEGFLGSAGKLEKIQADFQQEFVAPKADFELSFVEADALGQPISVSLAPGGISNGNGRATFGLHLDSADFQGQNAVQIELTLHWYPTAEANDRVTTANRNAAAEFRAEEKRAYELAFAETVQDRVKAVSTITSRPAADLREEERIIVYRRLIQDVLLGEVARPDTSTHHVVAELVNAIFDVSKMLYFVAPEWWRPRLHRSRQQLHSRVPTEERPSGRGPLRLRTEDYIQTSVLAEARLASTEPAKGVSADPEPHPTIDAPHALASNTAAWGGTDGRDRDNYLITADSAPARLGSSLGWLMQLDGDTRRNAFLNAPWVKAVLPVRPGKEKAAINWLRAIEGMDGVDEDAFYRTDDDERDLDGHPLDGQPMIDVLTDLARRIARQHADSQKVGTYPPHDQMTDPALVDEAATVTSTPVDRVFDHGFFPLKDSFRVEVGGDFEIFDQWIEIVPTDQVVPVEVTYDPVTGRQIRES